jgi:uncharacterized membrane protein YphA (DoxX/SURF4 family)
MTRPPWGVILFLACLLFVSWSSLADAPGVWRSAGVAGHEVLAACQVTTAVFGALLVWPVWTRRGSYAPMLFVWAALFATTGTVAASIYSPPSQRVFVGASAFGVTALIVGLVVYWPWRWLRSAPPASAPDVA